MRKIIIVCSMLIGFNTFSQEKKVKETLAKGSVFNWKIEREIENDSDTTVYFYYGYQNQKYQHITDIGSVFITSKDELQQFINSLSEISKTEKGTEMSFEIGKYRVVTYDFANTVYIIDNRDKYTTMAKKKAQQFALELEKFIDLLDS